MNLAMSKLRVAVTSNSFSKDPRLKQEAMRRFPSIQFKFCDPDQKWNDQAISNFIEDCEGWIVGKEAVNPATLSKANLLEVICKYGVGLDNIDFNQCALRNISIYSEPGVNSWEVAEQTIASMIGVARNLFTNSFKLRQGVWNKDGGRNFNNKVVGVIGCGHVGSKVAKLAKAFSCTVLIHDILSLDDFCETIGASQLPFDDLLRKSDFVTLHVPLNQTTYRMIGLEAFRLMKKTSFLINTSRGSVVDEGALQNALARNFISGAVIDVFEDEPYVDNRLKIMDNFVGTPHIAGNSREAIWKMGNAALNGLEKFLSNR